MKLKSLAVFSLIAGVTGIATAAPVLVANANPGVTSNTYSIPTTVPTANNFNLALSDALGAGALTNWLAGYTLSVGGLGVGEMANVTFQYYGSEALASDTFLWSGVAAVNNLATPGLLMSGEFPATFGAPTWTGTYSVGANGLLPFSFSVVNSSGSGSVGNDATNVFVPQGTTSGSVLKPNFLYKAIDATSGYIMLDDDGSAVSDNHDDMVFKVSVKVPAPGVGLLLALGLVGIAASRKRRA